MFLEVHILVRTIVSATRTIPYKLNRPRNIRASLTFHIKVDKEEGQKEATALGSLKLHGYWDPTSHSEMS